MRFGFLFAAICLFNLHTAAHAEMAQLKLDSQLSSQDSSINWASSPDTQTPKLQEKLDEKGEPVYFVILKGSIEGKNDSLLFENARVPVDSEGHFSIEVTIEAPITDFYTIRISKNGDVTKGKMSLISVNWENFILYVQDKKEHPRWKVLPILGFSSIQLAQDSASTLNEIAINVGAEGRYHFALSRWDIILNGSFGLPVTTSLTSISTRPLDFNLYARYESSWLKGAWHLSVGGGLYYSTVFTDQDYAGYQNITGPEVFPRLQYEFSKDRRLGLTLKYGPIFQSFGLYGFNSRLFGVQVTWEMPIKAHQLEVYLEYHEINLVSNGYLSPTGNSVLFSGTTHLQSYSLNGAFHW